MEIDEELYTLEGIPVCEEAKEIGAMMVEVWSLEQVSMTGAKLLAHLMSKMYSVAYNAGKAAAADERTSLH